MGIRETAGQLGSAVRGRFSHVEESPTPLRPVDPALQQFLDNFHDKFPMGRPMRTYDVEYDSRIREVLELTIFDMRFLLTGARRVLIDPTLDLNLHTERMVKAYDATGMDALVALRWSMEQILTPPYHTHKDADWQEIGAHAKRALGDNPAAAQIHIEDRSDAVGQDYIKSSRRDSEAKNSDPAALGDPVTIRTIGEHYFDSIADPDLREDLARFKLVAKQEGLDKVSTIRVVSVISRVLGVRDNNMISRFYVLQADAVDRGLVQVTAHGYSPNAFKFVVLMM